ncbi:polyunsaturated fatty acid lipoxygenase ALOX15B-like isoform X9 [Astyanax mexicanus]|uniref:polyunsaturated fatty acid lipoxygenase ALOX15B-like isoform X9 n=1 Tax=Astyanax mexicanus TaxID=7994 RepID=UPI0020CB39B1|nr:polyunsaturated fatty acid lipoxygenase ALOX15B-like isoform X9 [Astyanax mexicanus]
MSKYNIQVFTGDYLGSGTSNRIYINLIGKIGSSGQHWIKTLTGLWAGSEQLISVHCKSDIGDLLLVELEAKPVALGLIDDDWFCSKIIVTTPEGVSKLFPCYCWMSSNKRLSLREAVAKLGTKDTAPELLAHRQDNLKRRRQDFRWGIYAEGLPHIVNAESPTELPPVVRFSFTKEKEFLFTLGAAFKELKLGTEFNNKDRWNNIGELSSLLSEKKKTTTLKYVEKNWMRDDFFGYQFLNGLNPTMIKRCSELPENFPVTNDMVKSSLPQKSTLEMEIEKGNIFLCDYKRLNGLQGNEIDERKQYLSAPLCLLFSTPENKLMPIAIQLDQKPGAQNPIFLPSDNEKDWLLAKIFVRGAEFNEHELNFHLLRTHLLGEVFTMAVLRNLPSCHPLFKLLVPHVRYNLQINIMARNLLVSPDGVFSQYTAIGNKPMTEFLKRAASSLTYSSLCLPDNIRERGVEKIPNYYYRDDGLDLWNIISSFVHGVLSFYYNDEDVQKDKELQAWIDEIVENCFQEKSKTGFPQSFVTVEEMSKFVTMVIFTVSAQHAAVNNGQFDFGAWMPNFPSSLQCPPPIRKGDTTDDTILKTLPDVSTTLNIMAVVYLLSRESSDRYPLGYFPEALFREDTPLDLIAKFQEDLRVLDKKIEKRNKKLDLPYTYLSPKNVDNSIAI